MSCECKFVAPKLEDRQWAAPLFQNTGSMGCQYNFNSMYLWSGAYPQQYCRVGDRVVVRLLGGLGESFLFPPGTGPLAPALEVMEDNAKSLGVSLVMVCVTPDQKEQLEAEFPGRFTFEEDRDSFDYLYDVNKMADLPGKKLHQKRNHIRRFDDNNPDWMFHPITKDNMHLCLEMEKEWANLKDAGEDKSLSAETVAIIEALYQMDALEMEGGVITAGGRPVAFSLGSLTTPECFNVHFEKAFADIQGSYPTIAREMARMVRERHPQVKWLNREDDLGLEGLRKAKLSYYPELLLEKYTVREASHG